MHQRASRVGIIEQRREDVAVTEMLDTTKIDEIREIAASQSTIAYLPDDATQARRLRRLAAPLKWDVGMGAIVLFVVTIAFMMSGAAVLYLSLIHI